MPMFVSANPMALRQATTGGMYDATTEYLRNRLDALASLGNVPDTFMQAAQGLYDQFHSSDLMRQVRAVTQQLGGLFKHDGVYELGSIEDFQQARPIMQRLVMACPEYRTLYLNFEADGYSETYVNIHGNDVGEKHPDYRLVMDGMLIELPNNELVTRHYCEEQDENDPVRLEGSDRIMISGRVWDRLRLMIQEKGQDPGSIYCENF